MCIKGSRKNQHQTVESLITVSKFLLTELYQIIAFKVEYFKMYAGIVMIIGFLVASATAQDPTHDAYTNSVALENYCRVTTAKGVSRDFAMLNSPIREKRCSTVLSLPTEHKSAFYQSNLFLENGSCWYTW